MKPNETAPLLVTLAPALAAAPPVLIVAAIGIGLYWLLSGNEDPASPPIENAPAPRAEDDTDAPPRLTPAHKAAMRRITREDLAEALSYGARSVTRQEAVAALQALGFQKTAAYKALSPDGRFRELLSVTPDGLIEWIG